METGGARQGCYNGVEGELGSKTLRDRGVRIEVGGKLGRKTGV